MIRYELRCASGCQFEAWFRDSAAYDAQRAAGQLSCAMCGCAQVEKRLMAPSVRTDRAPQPPGMASGAPSATPSPAAPPQPSPPPPQVIAALAALRRKIEKEADYVGPRFAQEARRIHLGDAEERVIYGEATVDEARALLEEEIPIAPLPPAPRRDD